MSLPYRLSRGVLTTMNPPIPRAYEWAARYTPTDRKGPLLDMSQGAPGIPPPLSVQRALAEAAGSPASFGYGRWDGENDLRKEFAKEMKHVYSSSADVTADDIAFTSGCNLAFVATAMCLADAGDEVILPTPWYFNHQMALNLMGVKVVPLATSAETNFCPSVDACKGLISDKTKAIVLVSPNNPTGAVYPPSLLASFAQFAHQHKIALIIDETYRDFIVSSSPPHALFSQPHWRDTFIHLFSFSKSYCLPGHRLGAIVASPLFLASTKIILDTIQISAPRPIQQALTPLLSSLRPFLTSTAQELQAKHALFKEKLPRNWKIGSQGGYFAFVRHPFERVGSTEVCRRLAEEVGVITLPASFFLEEKQGRQGLVEEDGQVDWEKVEQEQGVEEEQRWIRFSVGNVDDAKVMKVCERLRSCEDEFNWRTMKSSD